MRFRDLLLIGLFALWRQKLRSALTLLGVVIGAATLTVSLSLGKGLAKAIDDQFRKEEALRQIEVFPSFDAVDGDFSDVPPEVLDVQGDMNESRRERIREAAAKRWKRTNIARAPKPLNKERVAELAAIPHVATVMPAVDGIGRTYYGGQSSSADISGVSYQHRRIPDRLEGGRGFSSDTALEVMAHEYLLYRLGLRNEAEFHAALGQPIRLELVEGRRHPLHLLNLFGADATQLSQEEMLILDKAWKLLPTALSALDLKPAEKALLDKVLKRKGPGQPKDEDRRFSTTLTLVGIIRSPPKDDKRKDSEFLDGPMRDAEVLLPLGTADALFGELPSRQREGYTRVRIIVDDEANVKPVVQAIKKMGLQEFSMGLIIDQVKTNVQLISFGMNFIALIALVVAALGITNTLFTSVLERTREIGLMKAVGAKDQHVLTIFLFEGSLIGLLGGWLGLLFGWLVTLPADSYARNILSEQTGEPPPMTMFLFPGWLVVGVPLFAVAVTTLAAALPARRAARIHPVEALRYE